MHAADASPSVYGAGGSPRSRAIGIVLAVAANLLLLVMLLRLAPPFERRREEQRTVTFNVPPPRPVFAGAKKTAVKRASGGATPHAAPPKPTPPRQATSPAPTTLQGVLMLSQQDYAAADIAKLPSHPAEVATNEARRTNNDTPVVGHGPNGEPYYQAQLIREPTDAEWARYVPKRPPSSGWGEVVCQFVSNNHVDNCRELGESPPGSGLSRMMREATWQFLFRPPRIGGHPIPGALVVFRLDWTNDSEFPHSARPRREAGLEG